MDELEAGPLAQWRHGPLDNLRKERRDEILRIAGQRGAGSLRVFGSVARGEANENSDLDLLVAWEPGRSLLDHAGLAQDLQELLGMKVHMLELRRPSGGRGDYRRRLDLFPSFVPRSNCRAFNALKSHRIQGERTWHQTYKFRRSKRNRWS